MSLKIDPQIVRYFWPGFIPLALFICLFTIAAVFGRYKRRQLLTVILWFGAVAAILTAYVMWIIVGLSSNDGTYAPL